MKSGVLFGKKAICDYLDTSCYNVEKLVRAGMPVLISNGWGWIAHVDNIEDWLRKYTRKKADLNLVKEKNTSKIPRKYPK